MPILVGYVGQAINIELPGKEGEVVQVDGGHAREAMGTGG